MSDTTLLKAYSSEKKAVIIKQNEFMPLWFILSCSPESELNAMEYANMYYESGLFQHSEPDLIGTTIMGYSSTIVDPYFSDQWGIRNTGQYGGVAGMDINVTPVWDMSVFGKNTVVGVIDTGIQLDHPDLKQNIHSLSYDSGSNSSPSKIIKNFFHGTACAGIIGAVKNRIGIMGVAPQCKLMSISDSLSDKELSHNMKANAINWAVAHGADIISNSWGTRAKSTVIKDAIDNAVTNGRNGLGCVVVFATGNANSSVSFPAFLDNVIGVGAITPAGKRKIPHSSEYLLWGSNYGNGLDIVAPGIYISTTDLTGSEGVSPGNLEGYHPDYYKSFFGTSAACPFVAGVASLILSENPLLTCERVKQILMHTATKLPAYTYGNKASRVINPENDPNPYELDELSITWNNETGSGLVNAHQAVLLAQEDKPFIYGGPKRYFLANLPKDRTVLVEWTIWPSCYYISSFSGDQSSIGLEFMCVDSAPSSAVLTAKIYVLTESADGEEVYENYICTVQRTITRTSSFYVTPYRIAENPVNHTLRLLKNANDENSHTMQARSISSQVTVNLYSSMTRVISQTFSSLDDEITLDTSGLPTGNYILNVVSDGKIVLRQTLFIKH